MIRRFEPASIREAAYNLSNVFTQRRPRLIAVFLALFSLLFMQVAVAGYACPIESKAVAAAEMARAGMPCAGEMESVDTEQPSLCHAHCQAEKGTEKVSSPALLGEVSAGVSYEVHRARVTRGPQVEHPPSFYRAVAPPLSVRNCCFRI